MSEITLMEGECMERMQEIPNGSVDMVLCDLPYGTTACAWDSVIPLGPLWEAYGRVVRTGGALVLTSTQPFTTQVIASNISQFKYCWYWDKQAVTGFANAKIQPLRCVEDIIVFCSAATSYFPQGVYRIDRVVRGGKTAGGKTLQGENVGNEKGALRSGASYVQEFTNYPKQLLKFSRDPDGVHPTQKPVALMEYLIKTYTNKGETVLDNTMGSGTTGVACVNTERNFIGIERDPEYFRIATERIKAAQHRFAHATPDFL